MRTDEIKSVHFIGVGGVGMSGIALVAHDQGMVVSGSDLRSNCYTRHLEQAGIPVFVGQATEHIATVRPDVVVVSTAIMEDNPELVAAKSDNIPIWHRAQMLAYLGRGKRTLAVAGTHGKTTTTSMVATVLRSIGADPTFLIGGIVRAFGTNAHSGTGDFYVVEADESDKSMTYLDPYAVLVTNVEADHLDHYSGVSEIRAKFGEFMGSIPEEGVLVVGGDDPILVDLAKRTHRRVITYGQADSCDARILSWQTKGVGSCFTLALPDGEEVQGCVRQNPGIHNVRDAAGCLVLLWALGEDVQKAAAALCDFSGVRRRFDFVGQEGGITVVDDYAHHPTEIAATIAAAKNLDFNRVHVLFQPHRYSRIKLFTDVLRDDFAHAFDQADTVTFTDVYSAGEIPLPGVNGKTFMDVLLDSENHPALEFVLKPYNVVAALMTKIAPGDLVLTMGAGDVTSFGPQILEALRHTSR